MSWSGGMIEEAAVVFTPLRGQLRAVQLLTAAVVQGRIAPAYLFVGPEGVGRALGARCFIELLFRQGLSDPARRSRDPNPHPSQAPSQDPSRANDGAALRSRLIQGNHPDVLWVEPTYLHQGKTLTPAEAEAQGLKRKAPPQIRLEQIRELARFLSYPPLEAPRSVVVIEQAETMAEAAANGLLKTLEEPGLATLILLSPRPDALLPTLVSRCQRIPFVPLNPADLEAVLAEQNQGDLIHQPELLALAEGSPGAAIAHSQRLAEVPTELLSELQTLLQQPSPPPRQALSLAAQLSKALDLELQIWLLGYLQHWLWERGLQVRPPARMTQTLQQFEQARQRLLRYVQPLLVWEVLLLGTDTP